MEDFCCKANYTCSPTPVPTSSPTPAPSAVPSPEPSAWPSSQPSVVSTEEPTSLSTPDPTGLSTLEPTSLSTPEPTGLSVQQIEMYITQSPTYSPKNNNYYVEHHHGNYEYKGILIGISIIFSFFLGMYIGIKKKSYKKKRSTSVQGPKLPPRLATKQIRYTAPNVPSPTFADISGEEFKEP